MSENTDSKISGRETQILAIFSYKVVALLFLCSIVNFKRFILFYPVGVGLCVLKQMLLTETFRKVTLATMGRVVWSREPQRGHGFCSEVGERWQGLRKVEVIGRDGLKRHSMGRVDIVTRRCVSEGKGVQIMSRFLA